MEQQSGVLENLQTGVLLLNEQLQVVSMNTAAEMLLGISARRWCGRPAAELLLDNGDWMALLRQTLAGNTAQTRREMRLSLLGGEHATADVHVSVFESPPQLSHVLVELHEVARLHRISREERLLQAQQATREAVRGMAHEIKNPLGGVRGAAQLLARELPDTELREYTDIIIQEADRLTALVDRLLGPRQQLAMRWLNIHEVLEQVHKLIVAEAGERLQLVCDYDPSVPELPGDRNQLMQAVLNIVRNAMQALEQVAPEQARITLKTRVQRQFTIGNVRHRLVCRIDIIDTGPGISPQLEHALFMPMVSGRADGTGLGLSIAQTIISTHAGLLAHQRRANETVFTLYLPMESNNGG